MNGKIYGIGFNADALRVKYRYQLVIRLIANKHYQELL